jgi:hypothetical protein
MTSASPADFSRRRVVWAGVGAALLGLAGWIALRNLSLPSSDGWIFWVPIASWLVTMGLLCWGSALAGQRGDSQARIHASWRTGWLVGGVGLALGFLGPLILTPKASLGPLLGILLTGPLGFVLGALIGAVRRPKPAST